PWGGDPLFRFFAGDPSRATRVEPDGTLVRFNTDEAGTFGIFMSTNPGSMPVVPDQQPFRSAGGVYFNAPYDSLRWEPLLTAREVPEPTAMTLLGVSLVATA